MKQHLAIYGSVKIPRAFCKECEGYALVIDGALACCGAALMAAPKTMKRLSEAPSRRAAPKLRERRRILEEQRNCCLYCGRMFGSIVMRKGRVHKLKLTWDHLIPWAFNQDNSASNFAAACHVCNGWKKDHVFKTLDEARVFINDIWARERAELDA